MPPFPPARSTRQDADAVARTTAGALWLLQGSDLAWRQTCMNTVARIPAGYTYLLQLMGHDLGSSLPIGSVPVTLERSRVQQAKAVRYNLIENPLTLETIYGAGPAMLGHLYHPATRKFRIPPGVHVAPLFRIPRSDQIGIRALHDDRNRDTLMLHELAAAWMQFHNQCVDLCLERNASEAEAYDRCRMHSVRVWHSIIRHDLLPRFIHPEISDARLEDCWSLDEATMLHGLMRAFHSLPLSSYVLLGSGRQNLKELTSRGYGNSFAEGNWRVDWNSMFGDGGQKTGVSASMAQALSILASTAHGGKAVLAQMDAKSAIQTRALTLGHPRIQQVIATLPASWPRKITPDCLAPEFARRYPHAPILPTSDELRNAPIFLPLMIEAQLHGHQGGLGPLGSALLQGSVAAAIDRVVLPEVKPIPDLPHPTSMLELIHETRRE